MCNAMWLAVLLFVQGAPPGQQATTTHVSGRIIVEGTLPANVPHPRISFSLAPIPGIPGSAITLPANAQPDGSFSIVLPEGARQIRVLDDTIPPGYKLASFTYGT